MTSPGEQTERQAFVQASIDATQELLTDDNARPHLNRYFDESELTYHERLVGRMFAAEVVDGAIRIPEARQATDDIPVVAVAPGETLVFSTDFARLSPIIRENMSPQLSAWGATLPHEAYTGLSEYLAKYALETEPARFHSPPGAAAILSSAVRFPVKSEFLPLADDSVKWVTLRPALSLRYEGPGSPLPSRPTMMHEKNTSNN